MTVYFPLNPTRLHYFAIISMRRHDKNVLVTKFMKGILAFLQNCKTRHNEIVQAQHHDKGGGEQIADKLCLIN